MSDPEIFENIQITNPQLFMYCIRMLLIKIAVFNFFRNKETFYTMPPRCPLFKNIRKKHILLEWGYFCLFSSFTSQTCGVAIQKLVFSSKQTIVINFILITIYGPYIYTPKFYDKTHNIIDQIKLPIDM